MTKTTSARHADILNKYQAGEGPFSAWAEEKFGALRLVKWSFGEIAMSWEIDDRFIMPDGVMFGGHIAAIADHIVGLASMTVLEGENERFRTSRLETNFFRPLMKPKARIAARVVNASRSLIHAEADIFNGEDKLSARILAVQMRRRAG